MRAALSRRTGSGRGVGVGAAGPGIARAALAGAKTARSARSTATITESRGRPDSISAASIIRGNSSGHTSAWPPSGPTTGAFALGHLLEYTSTPFLAPKLLCGGDPRRYGRSHE